MTNSITIDTDALNKMKELQREMKDMMDEYAIPGCIEKRRFTLFGKPIALPGIPPPQYMLDAYQDMTRAIAEEEMRVEMGQTYTPHT